MSILGFAISITGPIFLVVLLGFFLRHQNVIDSHFVQTASSLVYRIGLPAILFLSIFGSDLPDSEDILLTVFMVFMTGVTVILSGLYARLKGIGRADHGVFIQGGYRGNLAIIGIAFCVNAYGTEGLAQATIPMGILTILYNLLAIAILDDPRRTSPINRVWGALTSVIQNPLIVAILLGFLFKFLDLPLPGLFIDTGEYFAALALPLALICIGASIDWVKLRTMRSLVITASVWKIVITPALFVAGALLLGWRGQSLGIIFFLSAAPTATASFIMVRAMRLNDSLAAGIVVATTVGAVFTVTVGLYGLRSLALI